MNIQDNNISKIPDNHFSSDNIIHHNLAEALWSNDALVIIPELDKFLQSLLTHPQQILNQVTDFKFDQINPQIEDQAFDICQEINKLVSAKSVDLYPSDLFYWPVLERLCFMETIKYHPEAPKFHKQNRENWEQAFWKYGLAIHDILSGGPQIEKDMQH